jgi:Domain of unknown function (DUF5666)
METSSGPFEADATVTDLPPVTDTTEALALLSVSAARDDIGAALSRRPRARIPSLTLLLGALLVAGAGFVGGALVYRHIGGSGSGGAGFNVSALRSALAGSGTGRTGTAGSGFSGFAGGGSGTFGGGNATIGSVKLVDGSTLYVETSTGSIVTVTLSPSTKITISSTGTIKDLSPGEDVIVEGTKNSSGNVAATSISQSSLGSTGGAG